AAKTARDEEVKKRGELQPPVGTDPVTLPEDRNAARKLEAVRDYTNEGSWPEAVRLLQGMLEAREDGFFRLEETDVKGKTTTRWTSARAEADRVLAGLPRQGLETYRLSYDGVAKRMLTEALRRGDAGPLAAGA